MSAAVSEQRSIAIGALRLHPDAERVPMPDAADLRTLRESLAEDGQQDPIDATEEGVILDGRTRWTLLRDLGAETVQVRVVYVPEDQQTHYIVTRALARRHLTMAQKRVLNDLLRVQVIEVRPPRYTDIPRREAAGPMRIGYSQTERAEKLGVERNTVVEWDRDAGLVAQMDTTSPAPTHAVDKRGRPQPIHKLRLKENEDDMRVRMVGRKPERREPLRKGRPIPSWSRLCTVWLRGARPEDRDYMRRLDRELHAALERNAITCERESAS